MHDPIMTGGFSRVQVLHKTLDAFEAEEKRLLAERSQAASELRQTMTLVLILGGLLCVVLAAVISIILSRPILAPPGNLSRTVAAIAAGDQSARATVIGKDALGRVTEEFNRMAQSIQANQQRELDATNTLKSKVDALLTSVSRGATGDLTGKVIVSGSDAIGQFGDGLSAMFDNLRGLLMKIQRAGIQVTTSTTEIAASARQQEATGVEQAQVNMKRMDDTMQNMVNATDSINAKLAALSEKASNINNVLVTITKVADQTNILSLNAAIEAEKAGDAGRGFAVVATEIRRLADQTSIATWDIEQMLKEMQSAVSASVMGMDKFSDEIRRSVGEVRQVSEQLSSVIVQVQQLPPRFDAVLEGMQSQSIGASQITETMMQLCEASQQTVESLKATSDAVNQLQHAARDLQASVANFSVND